MKYDLEQTLTKSKEENRNGSIPVFGRGLMLLIRVNPPSTENFNKNPPPHRSLAIRTSRMRSGRNQDTIGRLASSYMAGPADRVMVVGKRAPGSGCLGLLRYSRTKDLRFFWVSRAETGAVAFLYSFCRHYLFPCPIPLLFPCFHPPLTHLIVAGEYLLVVRYSLLYFIAPPTTSPH